MTKPDLPDAVAAHYQRPPDRQRQLEREADGFSPDAAMETAIKARERDPAAYDASLARMGGSSLPLALYQQRRAAAIALGRFTEGDTE